MRQKFRVDHSLRLTVLYTCQDDNVNRWQHICQIFPLDSLIQNVSHFSEQPISSRLDEIKDGDDFSSEDREDHDRFRTPIMETYEAAGLQTIRDAQRMPEMA